MIRHFASIVMTLLFLGPTNSQTSQQNLIEGRVFNSISTLYLNLSYSKIDIRAKREDTIYTDIQMKYSEDGERWDSIKARMIGRGNFRFKVCYFPPLKLKIKKSNSVGTIFEGHKTLKLVLPCMQGKDMNDNVTKEYLAYKLYEALTPFSFRTRLVTVTLDELKDGEHIKHEVKGFLIEDDKNLARRLEATVIDGQTDPLDHDDNTAITHAVFRFMIGNVDFSMAQSHNSKMLGRSGQLFPVPYDFDLSGFVNPLYGFVPRQIDGEPLGIRELTDRKYRGFKRNVEAFKEVRKRYLEHQSALLKILSDNKIAFENDSEYKEAYDFLVSFFNILKSDSQFQSQIIDEARSM